MLLADVLWKLLQSHKKEQLMLDFLGTGKPLRLGNTQGYLVCLGSNIVIVAVNPHTFVHPRTPSLENMQLY